MSAAPRSGSRTKGGSRVLAILDCELEHAVMMAA